LGHFKMNKEMDIRECQIRAKAFYIKRNQNQLVALRFTRWQWINTILIQLHFTQILHTHKV